MTWPFPMSVRMPSKLMKSIFIWTLYKTLSNDYKGILNFLDHFPSLQQKYGLGNDCQNQLSNKYSI